MVFVKLASVNSSHWYG